jgi:hypothetical protein
MFTCAPHLDQCFIESPLTLQKLAILIMSIGIARIEFDRATKLTLTGSAGFRARCRVSLLTEQHRQ